MLLHDPILCSDPCQALFPRCIVSHPSLPQSSSKETKIEAVKGLLVCFQTIIAGNPEWTSPSQSKAEIPPALSPSDKYKVWLRQGYEEFHRGLCCLVTDTNSDVQVSVNHMGHSL